MKSIISYKFLILAVLFFGAAFIIERLNGSFLLNDFKVYYYASGELISGGNPYGKAFGLSSGFFKYSPVSLFAFIPYHLFSFEAAKTIHFILIAVIGFFCFQGCLLFSQYHLGKPIQKKTGLMSLLLLAVAVHLTRELHLGNINLLLIWLVLSAWFLVSQKKEGWAAVILALLVLIKPYFLIVFLVFFVNRQWKLIGLSILFILILSVLPSLFVGPEWNLELHKHWLQIMFSHSSDMISEHTFNSIFFSYTGVRLANYWQLVWIILVAIIYLFFRRKQLGNISLTPAQLSADLAILVALIPNLVITDSQHFLFSLPLIALILGHIFQKPTGLSISILVVIWFFYGANSNDLLGNPLSDLFDRYSTIGVANLGLIALFFRIQKQQPEKVNLISF